MTGGILSDLTFLRPGLLWLAPVPLALLLLRRAPARPTLGAPLRWMDGPSSSVVGTASWYGTRILSALAATLLVWAGAGPVRAVPGESEPVAGAAVMVVLDVSASMAGGDPSPLSSARESLLELTRSRRDVRLGLVTFAGSALTRLPPTTDLDLLEVTLSTAEAGIRVDGTALGTAVGLAAQRLAAEEARERLVVIVSDGMHNAGAVDPVTAAGLARRDGTAVHALLLAGSPPGGRALLLQTARAGGGRALMAPVHADSLLARLETLAPVAVERAAVRQRPAWAGPVRSALALLAVALLLHALRPGRWRWWPPTAPALTAAVLLGLSAAVTSGARRVDPAATGDTAENARTLRVAVDVSRSMGVTADGRSRLDRGRAALRAYLVQSPGVRVELAVFGARIHTVVPPTTDLDMVLRYLDALEPGILSDRGTGRAGLGAWLTRRAAEDNVAAPAVVVTDAEWYARPDSRLPEGLPPVHVIWTDRPEEGRVPGTTSGISRTDRAAADALAEASGGRVVTPRDGLRGSPAAARVPAADAARGPLPEPPVTALLAGFLLSLVSWIRGGRR